MKCTIKMNGMDCCHKFKGELAEDADLFRLSYCYSGDGCTVSGKDGDIIMERRGSVGLIMRFTEGRHTDCTLGNGENAGTFSIYTEKATVKVYGNGLKIQIKYKNGDLKNDISLIAEKLQEKL